MTTLGPRAVATPPPLSSLRVNLLSSVGTPQALEISRWAKGIAYQPERAAGGSSFDPAEDVGTGTKTTTAGADVVEWDPYIIWAGDRCTTIATPPEEIEGRARRQLDAQTSHLIEGILWTNTVDGADFGDPNHPNVGLSDASEEAAGNITTPNAWESRPPVSAFRDMVEALDAALGGARGMIHVEHRLLPALSFYGLVIRDGNRLIATNSDHIVVPGTGYTGSDPQGNAASDNYSWIYGTSPVEVLLSEIFVDTNVAGSVNRSTNLIEYRAERLALAHWDRQAHIGIPVCIEDPAGDCSDIAS